MEDLRTKLEAAFDNVVNARKCLLEAKEETIAGKETLKDYESELISSGEYQASATNERGREAWLRGHTAIVRPAVAELEADERTKVLALEIALDARRNLESILRIEELEAT